MLQYFYQRFLHVVQVLLRQTNLLQKKFQLKYLLLFLEDFLHQKQGYELRYGNHNNKHRTENFFELNPLLVDHQRNDHTQEIVGKRRKKRPNQRPEQYAQEGS